MTFALLSIIYKWPCPTFPLPFPWASQFTTLDINNRLSIIYKWPLGDKPLPYLSLTLSLSLTIYYIGLIPSLEVGCQLKFCFLSNFSNNIENFGAYTVAFLIFFKISDSSKEFIYGSQILNIEILDNKCKGHHSAKIECIPFRNSYNPCEEKGCCVDHDVDRKYDCFWPAGKKFLYMMLINSLKGTTLHFTSHHCCPAI